MTLPVSQLVLDDLFIEMFQRLGEYMDASMVLDDDGELELTDEQLTAWQREFVWELLARTLLLCQSVHATTQNHAPGANGTVRDSRIVASPYDLGEMR